MEITYYEARIKYFDGQENKEQTITETEMIKIYFMVSEIINRYGEAEIRWIKLKSKIKLTV